MLGGRHLTPCFLSLSTKQQPSQEAQGNLGSQEGRGSVVLTSRVWVRGCPFPKATGVSAENLALQRTAGCCSHSLGRPAVPRVCGFLGVANTGIPFPSPVRKINLDWIFSCEGCPPPLCHYHNEMEVAR